MRTKSADELRDELLLETVLRDACRTIRAAHAEDETIKIVALAAKKERACQRRIDQLTATLAKLKLWPNFKNSKA